MTYDFNSFKKDKLQRPRDAAWANWWKPTKVGDKVQGYVRDVFYTPAQTKGSTKYPPRRVFTLEQPDGTLINVGIKRSYIKDGVEKLSFKLAQTDNVRLGDPLTLEFEREIPNPGGFPSKDINAYSATQPENAENPTVKQLEAISLKEGGTVTSDEDDQDGEEAASSGEEIKVDDIPFK